jgi:hypothetical protein
MTRGTTSRAVIRAAGLSLIDTRNWSVRTIDRGATEVRVEGDLLLATGSSWDPATRKEDAIGLAAYGLDGRRRFQLVDDRGVWVRTGLRRPRLRRRAPTEPALSSLRVVDLDAGCPARGERARPLPWLLLDAASGRCDG